MYEWMNIQIYKCFNPKYTHGQLYKVQMYNVQMYNVQKDNVQKVHVLNMSAVLGFDPDLLLAPTKEEEGQVFCQTPWKNTF